MSNPALDGYTHYSESVAQSLLWAGKESPWPSEAKDLQETRQSDLQKVSSQDYLPAGQLTYSEISSVDNLTAREYFKLSREFESMAYALLRQMDPVRRLAEIAAILMDSPTTNQLRKSIERLAKANTRGRLGDWPEGKTLGLDRTGGTCYLADARASRKNKLQKSIPKQAPLESSNDFLKESQPPEPPALSEVTPIAFSLPPPSPEVDYHALYHDALQQLDRANRLLILMKPYVPIEDLLSLQSQV